MDPKKQRNGQKARPTTPPNPARKRPIGDEPVPDVVSKPKAVEPAYRIVLGCRSKRTDH